MILRLLSDFYSAQIDARKRFKNETTFKYEFFPIKSLVLFLDAIHGLPLLSLQLRDLLLLIKFLRYEGKSDKSKFEKRLLDRLCEELIIIARADFSLETKLMVCVVCNSFDNFDSRFEKVSLFLLKNYFNYLSSHSS